MGWIAPPQPYPYVEILTPSTSECDCITEVIKLPLSQLLWLN